MAAVALGAVDRAGHAAAATMAERFDGIAYTVIAPGRHAAARTALCTLSWRNLEAAKTSSRGIQWGQQLQLQHVACV